jgi:hypothetical protein
MEYKPLDYKIENHSNLIGSTLNHLKDIPKKAVGYAAAGILAAGVLTSCGTDSPTSSPVIDTPTPYSTIDNFVTPTPLPTNTPIPIQGTPIPDYVLHPLYEGVVEKMDTATPEDVRAWVELALDEFYRVAKGPGVENSDMFLAYRGQAEKLIELAAGVVKMNNFEFEYYLAFDEPCHVRDHIFKTKEEQSKYEHLARGISESLSNDTNPYEAFERLYETTIQHCLGKASVKISK